MNLPGGATRIRPPRLASFAQRIGLGVAVAVTLPLFLAWLIASQDAKRHASWEVILKSQLALDLTFQLELLVLNMETGVRGYRLTGDEEFLEPYVRAGGAYGPALSELRSLLGTEGRSRLEDVSQRVADWRVLAASRVEVVRRQRLQAGAASLDPPDSSTSASSADKRSMDGIRAAFERLLDVESGSIRRSIESMRATDRRLAAVVWEAAAGSSLLHVAGSVLLFRAYRNRARILFAGIDRAERGENTLILLSEDDELGRVAQALNRTFGEIHRRDDGMRNALDAAAVAREELRQSKDVLQTANEELEAFSYSVSHDLRAPLRHIDGFSKLLAKRAGDALDEKGKYYLATISDSARRMGALIDDLISFSRVGRTELRRATVDLGLLAEDLRKELSSTVGERTVEWTIGALPTVEGDPALLRQVLANLLQNAVKYTSRRDVARIEVGSLPSENGDAVCFARDNGAGFDMAHAGKLFGVFQRLHRDDEFEGTGIGLANVKRIIERHGGRVWAEGAPGAGATFFFSLPGQRSGA